MKKIKTYKNFVIVKEDNFYFVFLKDEWAMGKGFRYPEIECGCIKEAMDFIDCY